MKRVPLLLFLFFASLLLFSQETTAEGQAAQDTAAEAPIESEAAGEIVGEAANEAAGEIVGEAASEAAGETANKAAAEDTPVKEKKGLDPVSVLDRDIDTATVQELSDWCRSLGLSGDGGKDTLANRLRVYYKLEGPAVITVEETEKKQPLVITIESAKTTEYFTVESVNEEYVRIKGGVSISIRDGDTLHEISAEEILYNRTREMMTASGGVVYRKKDANQSSGEETTFKGQGITINLNNWSTAFMEGVSDRSVDKKTTYRFSGEVISRSGDDSTVLRHARITNAAWEEPYWSIDASRLWLLPGSDFAILNAVIKVGEIPLLWFPAFFYPGGEVVFHPVLGIRGREGTFMQTTTYLLGKSKAQTETPEEFSSFTSIMGGGEGMEQKREGIFLRSTGSKATSANETSLSLMADIYSKLGYFLGSDLSIPAKKNLGALTFGLGLAYSRDIYDRGYYYTPYDQDGESNWHHSRLLNYEIPLRYSFESSGSVSGSWSMIRSMNFSWNLPFYSDPYVKNDFYNHRSTNSDVFTLLKTANKEENLTEDTYLGSYDWTLNSGFNFATGIFNPFINDLSVTGASMSVNFQNKYTSPRPSGLSYPPNSRFFYPNKFTLFNITASMGGTPLTLGADAMKAKTEKKDSGITWGEPFSPWVKDDNKDDNKSDDNGDDNNGNLDNNDNGEVVTANNGQDNPLNNGNDTVDELLVFDFTKLSRTTPAVVLGGHRFTLTYKINPTASSEIQFNSNNVNNVNQTWNGQEDVDWSDWAHQFINYKIEGNIGLNLTEKRNIYSNNLSFFATKSGLEYIYLNDEAFEYNTALKKENINRQVKNQTYLKTNWRNTFTFSPFLQSNVWKNTRLLYDVAGLLYNHEYDTNADSYTDKWGEWSQEKITTNRLTANINANVMDYNQSFSVNADLPPEKYDESKTPRKPSISGSLGINAWISTTTVSGGVKDPFGIAIYDDIAVVETLKFGKATLQYNMSYVPDNRTDNPFIQVKKKPGFESMSTSLTWGKFNASFRAQRSKTWYLDDGSTGEPTGWKERNEEEKLNPQTLNLNYSSSDNTYLKNTNLEGSVGMSTGINFNLQKYTNSSFNFNISTKLKINQFLDITLSSRSDNAQIYRYFRDMPFFEKIDIDIPGETNPFIDLLNSFRFDDIEKRRASGFKLRSFNFTMTHYLGDWEAKLDINLYPKLNTSKRIYEFQNDVAFIVKWNPIKEFKTDINYTSKDGLTYNTK